MTANHAKFDRRFAFLALLGLAAAAFWGGPARAAPPFVACGGEAMLGGAQLNCSHTNERKPAQMCNFSWTLVTTGNSLQVVTGTFLLPPGANNAPVYQASGFSAALSLPIVLCQNQSK